MVLICKLMFVNYLRHGCKFALSYNMCVCVRLRVSQFKRRAVCLYFVIFCSPLLPTLVLFWLKVCVAKCTDTINTRNSSVRHDNWSLIGCKYCSRLDVIASQDSRPLSCIHWKRIITSRERLNDLSSRVNRGTVPPSRRSRDAGEARRIQRCESDWLWFISDHLDPITYFILCWKKNSL